MATLPKKAMLVVHHSAHGTIWTLYRSDDGPVPFGLKFELRAPTGLAAALRSIASDLRENEPSTPRRSDDRSRSIEHEDPRGELAIVAFAHDRTGRALGRPVRHGALEFDAQSAHDEAKQARKRVIDAILA